MASARTYCRVCASHCGIVVDFEGEQVLRVRGDKEHPLTGGYSCSKGRALPEFHHGDQRLLHPMVRSRDRLRVAGWEGALDDVAEKLSAIIAESGPEAVGIFLGGGAYMDAGAYMLAGSIPRILGTPQLYTDLTIDVVSKIVVPELMMGVAAMLSRPDYERCRLVIYIGINPAVSHGHASVLANPTNALRKLTTQGEVWVIDPRRTETATKATRHLAPKPGSDYAILAFLVREVLKEGADRDYLARHAQGMDQLTAAVEPYDLRRASALSDVPPNALLDLLAAVRRAGRFCIETGTGLSMAREANVAQWLSWALMIITGSLDREGGAWINPGFLRQLDRMDIPGAPPEGWRLPGPKSRPELCTVLGEYPAAALPSEIEAGNLRALLNFSGNLVACMPGTDRTVAALRKLDVLATIEVARTATVDISTHAFPAKDQLERADLSLALDGAFPQVACQYTPAIVPPLGEARSFWWIMAQIGKRLGLDFLPGLDPDKATDEDVLAGIAARARGNFATLLNGEYVVAEGPVFGWVEQAAGRVGGWRLAPQPLVNQLAALAGETVAPLVLLCRRQPRHLNSNFFDDSEEASLLISPADAAKTGMAQGSLALVKSEHGQVEGRVQIDHTLKEGAMSIPHGRTGAYNVNRLTSPDDVDPLTGMPRFSGLPVTIHPLPDAVTAP